MLKKKSIHQKHLEQMIIKINGSFDKHNVALSTQDRADNGHPVQGVSLHVGHL